jgi:hypothetical protein
MVLPDGRTKVNCKFKLVFDNTAPRDFCLFLQYASLCWGMKSIKQNSQLFIGLRGDQDQPFTYNTPVAQAFMPSLK